MPEGRLFILTPTWIRTRYLLIVINLKHSQTKRDKLASKLTLNSADWTNVSVISQLRMAVCNLLFKNNMLLKLRHQGTDGRCACLAWGIHWEEGYCHFILLSKFARTKSGWTLNHPHSRFTSWRSIISNPKVWRRMQFVSWVFDESRTSPSSLKFYKGVISDWDGTESRVHTIPRAGPWKPRPPHKETRAFKTQSASLLSLATTRILRSAEVDHETHNGHVRTPSYHFGNPGYKSR